MRSATSSLNKTSEMLSTTHTTCRLLLRRPALPFVVGRLPLLLRRPSALPLRQMSFFMKFWNQYGPGVILFKFGLDKSIEKVDSKDNKTSSDNVQHGNDETLDLHTCSGALLDMEDYVTKALKKQEEKRYVIGAFRERLTQMNVRVVHKWTRPDLKEKVKIGSIELLPLDAENEVIQATITKQLVSYFGPKVIVGDVYTLRNLTVDSNIGMDKATSNPCRLKFVFSSKVQGTNDTSIPLHGYRFADFDDILNGKVPTTHYIGQWRVQTTFNATVFHVNPDIPEVKQFEPSFSTPSTSNSLQVIDIPDDDEYDVLSTENIKSICEIKNHEKKGLYYTLAKVVDVDCNAGWYYDSCKICWAKTVKNDNGRWICTQDGCDGKISGLSSSIPRFQVKLVVTDASNEEVDFVVFDSQITQFISHSASDLLAKLEKAEDSETAETSPRITPLKRSYPCPNVTSGNEHEMNVGTGDATSATKKPVIVKKEK
ncbi:hypothetical protein RND81_05G159500 [Saponaria officinalis]|uniref:Replication protein A 70 kDa DNA-binding subunit B/D first OB fold domain-containing protein n=1 Tax=Saponaria officinalis TaxID=3572 RepID=A0AAW1L1H9_SAPOF